MSALPKLYLTPEQYLLQERRSDHKHEYYRGEVFALAGASRQHNLITLNVGGELRTQLKKRSCTVYPSDLRVKIPEMGLYTYPDLVVVCGKAQFEDHEQDTLLNPTVIVEVLSKSSEARDRGEKFSDYRGMESIKDIILVTQHKMRVEHYVRQTNNDWTLHDVSAPDEIITIASIGCRLTLAEIYERVTFPPPRQLRSVESEPQDQGGVL